jgi:hypothetical protein
MTVVLCQKYKKEVPLTAWHKELVALVANHSYETGSIGS